MTLTKKEKERKVAKNSKGLIYLQKFPRYLILALEQARIKERERMFASAFHLTGENSNS
jgi:hypothetical protein